MAPQTRFSTKPLVAKPPQPRKPVDENQSDYQQLLAAFAGDQKSLSNYTPRLQQKAKDLARDILSSVYYDLNNVCLMRVGVVWAPTKENTATLRLHYRESTELLDRVFGKALHPTTYIDDDSGGTIGRLEYINRNFGTKMLVVCTLAEGFRRACRELMSRALWRELMSLLWKNRQSLDVFVRLRDLDWRGQLFKYANLGIKDIDAELGPAHKISSEHVHHIVQCLDKQLKRPTHSGHHQVHIDESIMDPEGWGEGELEDPTLRRVAVNEDDDDDECCDFCGSPQICECETDFLPGTMVELVERRNIGVGVRALMAFKKDEILGEFVGEIWPPDNCSDEVYALSLTSKVEGGVVRAIISPAEYGNWTRFISHSCRSSTDFVPRTVGNRIIMTVEASRDIAPFEDITLNYGSAYWEKMECLCGENNCVSKKRR